jgi:hypothetical protein
MDLRVVQQQQQQAQQDQQLEARQLEARQHMQGHPAALPSASDTPAWLPACELRLKLGAVIAAEMRQAVKQEAGFRCADICFGLQCFLELSVLRQCLFPASQRAGSSKVVVMVCASPLSLPAHLQRPGSMFDSPAQCAEVPH